MTWRVNENNSITGFYQIAKSEAPLNLNINSQVITLIHSKLITQNITQLPDIFYAISRTIRKPVREPFFKNILAYYCLQNFNLNF